MVSAWSAANGISLGQVKVDDKSNEITAIPLLINSLELSGCIVTIDAMGCQKDITQTIIEHDANYIIAIKENKKKNYQLPSRVGLIILHISPNSVLSVCDSSCSKLS